MTSFTDKEQWIYAALLHCAEDGLWSNVLAVFFTLEMK